MSAVVPQAACAKVIRKLRPPFGAHDRKLCALFAEPRAEGAPHFNYR